MLHRLYLVRHIQANKCVLANLGTQLDLARVLSICASDRFLEIVLKPITYFFDTSLFVTKKDFLDLNATQNERFEDLGIRVAHKIPLCRC